jgi:DNA-binding response OmpR family regulator
MTNVSNQSSAKRLLLVEDDRDSCEALASFLETSGYEVSIAITIAEGLRLSKENRYDAIILDNWFKESSGVELCRQIRAFDKDTPILFYSAAAYEQDIEEGLRAGAQDYVVKPNFEQFQKALSELIHRVK